jgi:cysteinyl-tRNA synthetase
MIDFILQLYDKGLAYEAKDGVYYDINGFSDYGKLSQVDLSAARTTERMLTDEYDKKTPNDFALWKKATSEELERGIFYESPWGKGRPGWHIECSVMSQKYLGDTLDIHSGGEDLIFPHHENEIAQSEGVTGKEFVRYWMHVGFLKINGRKMSKSLGNYVSFEEVLSKYTSDAFRYFYLSTHYRRQIDYTDNAMRNAESSVKRLRNTIDLVAETFGTEEENLEFTSREQEFLIEIIEKRHKFEESMDDDLDTHGAIDALHAMSRAINEYIALRPNKGVLLRANSVYRRLLETLGLFERQQEEVGELTEKIIELVVKVRERLRDERNFKLSDAIREDLAEIGVILADKPEGTSWKIAIS